MLKLVLLLLPVVMCAPDPRIAKRVLFDDIASMFNLDILKCDIQLMLDALGSDPTEQKCEQECHTLLTEGHVFNYGCKPICLGFNALVHKLHIVPDDGDPAHSKCHIHQHGGTTTTAASTK